MKNRRITYKTEGLSESTPGEADVDAKYALKDKERADFIKRLDLCFTVATHPFVLLLVLILICLLFLVVRYFSIAKGTSWLKIFGEDLKLLLTYGATFVFSSMFTWFIDNHSKIKKKDDK